MDTLSPNDTDHKREDPYVDSQDDARARALGQPLTQLLDRKQALSIEIQAIDADIYQLLVNLLQSQIGAVLDPLDVRIKRLERGR